MTKVNSWHKIKVKINFSNLFQLEQNTIVKPGLLISNYRVLSILCRRHLLNIDGVIANTCEKELSIKYRRYFWAINIAIPIHFHGRRCLRGESTELGLC